MEIVKYVNEMHVKMIIYKLRSISYYKVDVMYATKCHCEEGMGSCHKMLKWSDLEAWLDMIRHFNQFFA